ETPKTAQPAKDDRDASRKRDRIAKQRSQIEAEIEQKENQRAALATEMNVPDFYLARKDANDLIARYERLGREIEKLYADLVKFDEAASA
ncbi:MAG: ABC transporter C-terminal domain-containing protein, partial [Candidatus Binatus sp.]